MMRLLLALMILLLSACESNPPAPVITRAPQASKPQPPANTKPSIPTKDWRPDSHIVKKGDTLFGIGLEYGIDYKEIAAANNIAPPYPIKIGQKLDLTSFKTKTASAEAAKPNEINKTDDEGVVVSAIKTEPAVTDAKPTASAVTPILTEPKATREPYSLEALNRAPNKTPETNTSSATTIKPSEPKPTESKTAEGNLPDDESISWTWPTQGKISASFNEASNKGIDIAGTLGQTIVAASAGKVIYSGSDLRGYGKLVIVKHNKTYLSVYAHNSKIVAKEGQTVSAGQKIAEMGNTDSNSVKLHFEIRRLGKSVDPAKYLSQN